MPKRLRDDEDHHADRLAALRRRLESASDDEMGEDEDDLRVENDGEESVEDLFDSTQEGDLGGLAAWVDDGVQAETGGTTAGPTEGVRTLLPDRHAGPAGQEAEQAEVQNLNGGKFRCSCKHLGLTYAQVPHDWTADWLLEQLRKTPQPFEAWVVAKELHQDGGSHFHVYLRAARKFNIRSERYFDIAGHHPNIESLKHVEKWVDYCLKEDPNALTHGVSVKKSWHEATALGSTEAVVTFALENYPRDFFLHGEAIRANADYLFSNRATDTYVSPYCLSEFNWDLECVQQIGGWFMEHVAMRGPQQDRSPCLVIVGATRIGKSSLVRAFEPNQMYFKNDFALDGWRRGAKVLIYDDCKWDEIKKMAKLTLTNCVHQAGWVTDRYRKKTQIVATMPAVILWNHEDVPLGLMTDQYWVQNMVWVYIRGEEKLWKTPQ